MKEDIKVTESSGNVFEDLGLPDAEELSVKSRLVSTLSRLMERHGLTQTETAKRCGVDQPTLSKILRGRLDMVSTDRLLTWFARLDQHVHISIEDRIGKDPGAGPMEERVRVC